MKSSKYDALITNNVQNLRKTCDQLESSIRAHKNTINIHESGRKQQLIEKLQTLPWELEKADFVEYYEDTERKRMTDKMEQVKLQVEEYKEKMKAPNEDTVKELKHKKNILQQEVDKLKNNLQKVQEKENECKLLLKEQLTIIQVLKNRNVAMMRKATKQKQELKAQRAKLQNQLDEMENSLILNQISKKPS